MTKGNLRRAAGADRRGYVMGKYRTERRRIDAHKVHVAVDSQVEVGTKDDRDSGGVLGNAVQPGMAARLPHVEVR
jgi:hypothetical protein